MGRSGLQLSVLSLGSWVTFGRQVGQDAAVDCMAAAYDQGVNFFDNAEVYAGGEAETVMGTALDKLRCCMVVVAIEGRTWRLCGRDAHGETPE